MSLTDALLLEGYRDPREVYIALRADGQMGSGTIDDPYDGGTRLGPALASHVTCDRREFVVGFGLPGYDLNLTLNQQITVVGATGTFASWFNGVFSIKALTAVDFTLEFTQPGLPDAPPLVQHSSTITFKYTDASSQVHELGARIYWPVAKISTDNSAPHGLPAFAAVDVTTSDSFAGSCVALAVDAPLTGTSFRYRLTFVPDADITGGGNACTIARRIHRYDDAIKKAPVSSVIHLGPGTFETRGYCSVYSADRYNYNVLHVGSVLLDGQRLLGSGIDVTVLRLVLPIDELTQVGAVSSAVRSDYAEVADLTVDVNGPGHVPPFGIFPAPFTCGAVTLNGSFMSVRRVRAVNFCVQSRPECFAIGLHVGGYAYSPPPGSSFNVIEDCIVEQPAENNTHETTLLSSQGPVLADFRSCIVRHNYHNAAYANGWMTALVPVASLQRDATDTKLAVLTTTRPHTHLSGKALVVQGARLGGALSSIYNGVFMIEQIVSDIVLSYRLRSDPGTGAVDVGGASIGGTLSTEPVGISAISYNGDATATVTTQRPHQRLFKQNVLLGGVWDLVPGTGLVPSAFNGTFVVKAEINPNHLDQFVIAMPAGAPASASSLRFNNGDQATIGPHFFGRGGIGGTGCVTEGNAFYDCFYGCYQDTGSTRDLVIRDNYFSNVGWGVFMNFPAANAFDGFRETSAIVPTTATDSNSQTWKCGLFTTIQKHGLHPGDSVTIREEGSSAPAANEYHGTNLIVVTTPTDYQFTYRLASQVALPTDNCAGRPVFWPSSASIAIGTLSFTTGQSPKVTLVTSNGALHGLSDGDFITITGASDPKFNGFVGPIARDAILPTTKFSYPVATTDLPASGTGGWFDKHVAAGVVRNGDVATVTTPTPHGFFVGQAFKLQGAFINGFGELFNRFNGVVSVKATNVRSFSYSMRVPTEGAPDPDPTAPSPTGGVEYASHYDIRFFVLQNNVYDLYATDATAATSPRGLVVLGSEPDDAPTSFFSMLVWRENVVRHFDDQVPSPPSNVTETFGLRADALGNATVDQNIVDVSSLHPLLFFPTGNVSALQNTRSDGTLVEGFDATAAKSIDDLEARTEDIITFAFL